MHAWLLAVMIMATPRGPAAWSDLVEIARGSERAVVVQEARHLGEHVVPLLNWVGLAFPAWAPGPQGTLAGARGSVRILDGASRVAVGIPQDAPLAVLWVKHGPSPVLVVAGLGRPACASLGEAVMGAAPPDAAAWEKRGLCVVAVGECRVKACSAVGLPRPGKRGARDVAVADILARRPAWMTMDGGRLLKWLPPQARHGLDGLSRAWLGATVGASQRHEFTAIMERSAAWNKAGLAPLDARILDAPLEGTADVVVAPGPGFPLEGRAEQALAAWWGRDLRAAWKTLGVSRVHATWKGVDPRAAGVADGGPRGVVFALPGVMDLQCRDPKKVQARADERLLEAGFERDSDAWVKDPWMVRASTREGTARVETGSEPAPSPVAPPSIVPDVVPLLAARWHGTRVVSESRRVPAVAGAASPELRGLLGLDLLLGPSLERMGPSVLTAGTLPGQPRVLVVTVVSDVRMR